METAAGIYRTIAFPEGRADPDRPLSDAQMAMLDATPDCIKILSADGRLLAANRAGREALGVAQGAELGMSWVSLLPEAGRPAGLDALRAAAEGRNARFPGPTGAGDDLRHWDNLLVPVQDAEGRVLSILCVSRDVSARIALERDLEAAVAREKLLSREMQHRIKNLFAVVSGLVSIAESEASAEGTPAAAASILRAKLVALARASDAAFAPAADGRGGGLCLETLVTSVLAPYGARIRAGGAAVFIVPANMTTIALFLHEAATNSMKYGALGVAGGLVAVDWRAGAGSLDLTWRETGGPLLSGPPARLGFGSEMVDRIVQAIGGRITRDWPEGGLIAALTLPNVQGAGGPQPG